jgi:flavin reductase (DIM6/NTAB) family NADH-FMN oxidoreductase RutF
VLISRRATKAQRAYLFDVESCKRSKQSCLINEDTLAHLECTVESYLPSGDRTLIYAVVEQGVVSAKNGITAIQLTPTLCVFARDLQLL